MRSSQPISLFSRPPKKESGPSAFVVSMVLHGILLALLLMTVHQARVVEREPPDRKYEVHLLDMRKTVASLHYYPRQTMHSRHVVRRRSVSAGGRVGPAPKARLVRVSRNFDTKKPAPQTVIQPEVPPEQQVLKKIPIPHAMIWTADKITQRKVITPVPKPPSAIHVKPSLKIPNHELNPASVPLTSTPFVTKAPIPAPGTTVPVDVSGKQPGAQLPVTASKTNAKPTAARIIALSQMKLRSGTAALPVVQEIAKADTSGSPMIGELGRSLPGKDAGGSREAGTGVGHGLGHGGDHAGGVTVATGASIETTPAPDDGFTIDTGAGSPDQGDSRTQHITLPQGGQYGMVVVGSSPQEDYPETEDLWTGRLVYTVYLQTNTAQNWELQYSMPKVANDPPSDGTLKGPWPFDMIRPALKYQDVILVHGFVSAAGKFEDLSVVYPPGFAEAHELLHALKQWVFRPASLNGQATRVEVLLIIPGAEQ